MAVFVLVAGCGGSDDEAAAVSREVTTLEPSVRSSSPADPLDSLPDDEATVELGGAIGTLDAETPPPKGGCRELTPEPIKIWAAEALTAVTAVGDDLLVVGITAVAERPELFLVRISNQGRPTPLYHDALAPRKEPSRPAVASVNSSSVLVGYVDGETVVRVAELDARPGSRKPKWLEIGRGADPRFPPALAAQARSRTIAYTDGSLATSMRIVARTLSADGQLGEAGPVGLPGMGGAAPIFINEPGRSPRLAFIDPRAGPSPVVVAELDGAGQAQTPEVLLIAGSVYEPPEIAAASVGGVLLVGYTAIGQLATSAVGLRHGGDNGAARALVAGKGNGRLHLGATSGRNAAIFVADAMSQDERDGTREIHVRLAHADSLGETLVLGAASDTAKPSAAKPSEVAGEASSQGAKHGRDAAVARTPQGLIGVTFRSSGGTFASFVRCDDP